MSTRAEHAVVVHTRDDDEVVDLTTDPPHTESDAERSKGGDRGRDADGPGDIPKQGWKDVALRVKGELKEDQVPLLSAGVAFYILLALFPALAAIVSIYGLVADPGQVSEHVADLTAALPDSARQLITEQLESVVQGAEDGVGFALVGGILAALWSASSGMKHLVTAINAAYDEDESRKFFTLRGLSLLLTVGAVAFGVVAIGVLTVLPAIVDRTGLGRAGQTVVQVLSYPALAIGFGLGLAVLYRYAPDRDDPRWRWVSPGAAIATVVWILASLAFSFYASNFGSYSEAYGSIGAVIILMLWLVITAFSVVLGAEIDAEIEAQTAKDSTEGHPEPMGQRDAQKADELGAPAGS